MAHIDTSDKVKVFDSFDGLAAEIVNDMDSNDMLAHPIKSVAISTQISTIHDRKRTICP